MTRSNNRSNAQAEGRSHNAFRRFVNGVGNFFEEYDNIREEAFRRSGRKF